MSTRFDVAPMHAPVMWCMEGVSEESQEIRAMISSIASQQRILASFDGGIPCSTRYHK